MTTDDKRPIGLLGQYAREAIRAFLKLADDGANKKKPMFSGFSIPTERVAKHFKESHPEVFDAEVEAIRNELDATAERWISDPPPDFTGIAELANLFKLGREEVQLFVMAAAPAMDPSINELYSYVWDNVHKRCADVGFICQVLSFGDPARFETYLRRCDFDQPLRRNRLLLVEPRQPGEETLDLNLVDRRVRVADRVLQFLQGAGVQAVDEALASTCARHTDEVSLDTLRLPDFSRNSIIQIARSRSLPAIFEGPPGAGKQNSAHALASMFGQSLVSADLTALLTLPPNVLETRLAELSREVRLGDDLLYFRGHELPSHLTGPSMLVLQRAMRDERMVLGVDQLPVWLVPITTGWPVVTIPLPEWKHRAELWTEAFGNDKRAPDADFIEMIARRYELSGDQIKQAASEARRIAQVGRRRNIIVQDLDRACRAHFAHQLSDLATLVPPSNWKPEHLILPDSERTKFEEILLYSKEHDVIYNDWGFAEKFPYGRGLSVLFYGPPGTGKTMAACIIASVLGLDLFRVDLSRIMSRYVGETEKNLAKIFNEAEKGRVMLLFDEADALFTKRTAVKSSVDRYANLEVAFLLQRMENFEGITVLTTNVEANLDDAFKRRIRYRVYFPMPDAETRGRLWQSMIPPGAPLRKDVPFRHLGEYFEISGGHIKQAVLRAAFYSKRANSDINFEHLLEAGITECRELGMLLSDNLPKPIAKALRQERGEPEPPEEDQPLDPTADAFISPPAIER